MYYYFVITTSFSCGRERHHTIFFRATAEYPATIVPDSTCAHIFKERDMNRNKLTQVAGYSAVKPFALANNAIVSDYLLKFWIAILIG